ncbi:outer membrane protein [Prosthecodimorpha staleyi]|uniref:Porin family protein n=1 Tax=Prosthecodimorpha staleyi TaxID=2840188 RepID=A0A947D6V3_9HYPH|nr:outer membrane protein [Prosthecodimorpha staleyi]MBT9289192.1 porin family protein [Prosthecodimorpha staleyi]
MTKLYLRAAPAALALGLTGGAASAADLSRAPAPAPVAAPAYPDNIVSYGFNWTGAYVGANVGGRTMSTSLGSGRGSIDTKSAVGGLQAGYLFQTGNFVYGLEADFGYGQNSGSKSVPGGRVTSALDWTASGRARLGYAFDRLLVYGTGGIAGADLESEGRGGGNRSKKTDTLIGWTAGGGLEYAVTKNISLRAEYLYSDYGTSNVSYAGTGIKGGKQDITSNLGRLGVNFKF